MRVIDTSAWVEWLIGSDAGRRVGSYIPQPDAWLVPTIIQLELAKWLTRAKGEDEADRVIAFTQTCVIADLDTAIALRAAEYCSKLKLATADAAVYATAVAYDAELVTCDQHFSGLERVMIIPKLPN